jgi:hypothetical protein
VPDPGPAKISGAVLLDNYRAIVSILGPEKTALALATLPADMREEYLGLLPVSWCSIETSRAVLVATAEAAGEPVRAFQRKVVRLGIERTVRTVWRPLLRVLGDEALLKRTPLLYAKAYTRGELAVVFGAARAEFFLTGWPGVPESEADGLAVGIETVLDCSGRREASVTWERMADGARFLATWIPG